MNKPEILIISNTLDFGTDYICLELEKRNAKYLRINRDKFSEYKIVEYLFSKTIEIEIENQVYYLAENTLNTIYYRAPVYLRDIYQPGLSKEDQLYRTQWMAFIKNILIYESVRWINNPISTYKAENKLVQLIYAKNLDFLCPNTIVANTNKINVDANKDYIVKSIDTALLKFDEQDAFVYSNKIKGHEIQSSNINLAPLIIQEYIYPKIDVRVTVIENNVYSVRILKDGKGIDGDWRKVKNDLYYEIFKLPINVEKKCIELAKSLGLLFGAIDLIESKGSFYFLEINPTGEWSWLVNKTELPLVNSICDLLVKKYTNKIKEESMLLTISYYLFPVFEVIVKNYIVNKKYTNARRDIDKDLYRYVFMDDYQQIDLESADKYLQQTFEYKKLLEDKAKTNVIALTISVSIISAFSNIMDLINTGTIIISFIVIYILLMLVASILFTVKVIIGIPDYHQLFPKDTALDKQKKLKEIAKNTELNTMLNWKRNIFLCGSYRSIQNTVLGLVVLFISIMIASSYKPSQKITLKNIQNDQVKISQKIDILVDLNNGIKNEFNIIYKVLDKLEKTQKYIIDNIEKVKLSIGKTSQRN